ncbi:hypothetical protein ASG63_22520 [Methylobacterium sp. Leaf94]|uniref:hypothetical protein n=1 Tax=Methylobacterium sp. Leaf94 TaxID=1736250 RepID=UPI0006F25322|nr:hypothetical protein [Methylobacterium sp. Leaf94]KQU22272.1 hypothetical protein ASG63_22520 [Methylobacterium sp. Leaf94]
MPVLTAPPIDFGPPWRHVGVRSRFGHAMELFALDETPLGYADAWRRAREVMVDAGFSWSDKTGPGRLMPCWWALPTDTDVGALEAAVAEAVAAGAAARAEEDAKREAARLAELARVAEISGPIRERLLEICRTRPWSLGRAYAEAIEHAHDDAWTQHGLNVAKDWVAAADATEARTEARLTGRGPAQWHERANDPDVRDAALAGLRHIAGMDEDWASDANGVGFSQVTTWAGHLLAARDVLDQGAAAHALGILWQHRRQLPPSIAQRALGIEPKPQRGGGAGNLLARAG